MGAVVSPRTTVVLLLVLAALFGGFLNLSGSVHAMAVLPFLLLGPGVAWAVPEGRMGLVGYVAVAVSLSAAFCIIVAMGLLVSGLWSSTLGLWILVAAAAVGLLVTDE